MIADSCAVPARMRRAKPRNLAHKGLMRIEAVGKAIPYAGTLPGWLPAAHDP